MLSSDEEDEEYEEYEETLQDLLKEKKVSFIPKIHCFVFYSFLLFYSFLFSMNFHRMRIKSTKGITFDQDVRVNPNLCTLKHSEIILKH